MKPEDNDAPSFDALRRQFAPIELTRDTIGRRREVPYELRPHRDFVLSAASSGVRCNSPKSEAPESRGDAEGNDPDQLSFEFGPNDNE
jgi:hypothetical protein